MRHSCAHGRQQNRSGRKGATIHPENQDGEAVKLTEQAGKWVVLYFYPKDDTPGCTVEACDFTASIKDFEGMNAVVWGCSPDGAESHQKFIKKHDLKIDLLSDPNHTVMEKYGAWGKRTCTARSLLG